MNDTTSTEMTVGESTTLDQRAAILHEQILSESASPEPAAEAGEVAPVPPAEATPAPAADSADAKKADPAAERKARLEALRAKEQEAHERRARIAEQERIAKELEAARKEAEEAKARASRLVDLDGLDEASFLRLAHQKGIRPERIGDWIRESMANPERVAEVAAAEAARKVVEPKLTEAERRLMALEKQLEEERQQRAAIEARQVEERAAAEFIDLTKTHAESSPFAARYLEHRGPDAYYALAANVAQSLPPGAGYQAILDTIEEHLAAFAPIYGSTPSKPEATPSKKSAAAKATPAIAQLAHERASVVGEEDWSSLTLEDRAERMKAAR